MSEIKRGDQFIGRGGKIRVLDVSGDTVIFKDIRSRTAPEKHLPLKDFEVLVKKRGLEKREVPKRPGRIKTTRGPL